MFRIARASLVAALFALPALSVVAADKWPDKPVRLVVPFSPGGGTDLLARFVSDRLTGVLGTTLVIDNRAGAGGTIGWDSVAKSPPDGHTLAVTGSTQLIGAHLYKNLPYDSFKDFSHITMMASGPYVLVVNPALPARSVGELIALAKGKPGALSYGSQGLGTTGHVGWERFKLMAGVEILHVPYKGAAPAVIDTISGQVQMTFSNTVTSGAHIRSGKLRGLAITSLRRGQLFPEMPTVSEAGVPGFELSNSYAYYAPAGTPRGIVREINAIVSRGMNSPETVRLLAADGSEPIPAATPAEFKARFDRNYAELERLVAAANIRIN